MKLSIVLLACLVCAATAADANQKGKTPTGAEDLAKEKRGAAKSTVTVGVQQPIQQLEYLQPQQQHEQAAGVTYLQQPQQQLTYLQAQPQLQYLQAQPQVQQLTYLQAQPQVPLTYLQAQHQPQVAYLQPQQQLQYLAQPQPQQQPTVTYYTQEQQQLPQRSLSPQQLYAKYQSAPRTPAQTSAAVAEYLQGGQSQPLTLAPAAAAVQYPQIPVAQLGLGYSGFLNAAQQQPLYDLSGAAPAAHGYEVNAPAQSYRAPPPQAVQGRGLQIYQQPYIAQIQAQAESAQRQLNALYQQQQQQQQQLIQQQQILQPQQEIKG